MRSHPRSGGCSGVQCLPPCEIGAAARSRSAIPATARRPGKIKLPLSAMTIFSHIRQRAGEQRSGTVIGLLADNADRRGNRLLDLGPIDLCGLPAMLISEHRPGSAKHQARFLPGSGDLVKFASAASSLLREARQTQACSRFVCGKLSGRPRHQRAPRGGLERARDTSGGHRITTVYAEQAGFKAGLVEQGASVEPGGRADRSGSDIAPGGKGFCAPPSGGAAACQCSTCRP